MSARLTPDSFFQPFQRALRWRIVRLAFERLCQLDDCLLISSNFSKSSPNK